MRRLSSSNNHQIGAETRNRPTYFRQSRVNRDVPVRQKTSPSIVRQYPSHSGKKHQLVRVPGKLQLRIQKMMTRPSPNQPCKGNLGFSFSMLLMSVAIFQVYTEIVKFAVFQRRNKHFGDRFPLDETEYMF